MAKARQDGIPVVRVQHSDANLEIGSEDWELVEELSSAPDEPIVRKRFADSFEDTDLEVLLRERQVGRLTVTGAQTDAWIRSTLHGAFARGYHVTLVGDAHTTEDLRRWGGPLSPDQAIAYTNMYWAWAEAPGRTGRVVATADVTF